jgi:CheY-like chemotaxis protein
MGSAAARVLVVDDVDDVRETAVAILALAGYTAIAAASAEEALAALRQEPPPDLLFTDIVIGRGSNGFELAQRAILLRPGLKVLYATGYAWNLDDLHAAVPGSRLMMKPYRAAQLLREVELLLESGTAGDGARPPQSASLVPPDPAPTVRKAVLVVEDDARSRAIAADLFRGLGLAVLDAAEGSAGLALLTAHPEIAVLFADIRLPGISGVDLAETAHRLRPDLQIVLTSAYLDPPATRWTFVSKPWRPSDFSSIAGLVARAGA